MGERVATRQLTVGYYAARFGAQAVQNVFFAALLLIAGTGDHAALGLTSLFAANLVPALLLSLAGGALADRLGAARAYPLGAVFRLAAITLGLLICRDERTAWIALFAYSAGSQLFSAAEMSFLRALRPRTAGLHSFTTFLQYAGQIAGIAVAAPLLYWLGGPQAMLAGAVVGAVLMTALTVLLSRVAGQEQLSIAAERSPGMGRTMRYLLADVRTRYGVTTLALKMLVAKSIVVTLPLYIQNDMGLRFGPPTVAYVIAPALVGAIAGLIWAGRSLDGRSAVPAMRLSLAGMAAAVFALASLDFGVIAVAQATHVPAIMRLEANLNTTFILALPVAALLGASLSTGLVAARVALTESAGRGQQGRAYGLQMLLTDAIMTLPLILAGGSAEFAGARTALAVVGVMLVLALGVMEGPAYLRNLRSRPAAAPALAAIPVSIYSDD